jgi:hypothetical protein
MQLIFHDRRAQVTLPTGDAFLTIEHKGTVSIGIAAVALLKLKPTDEVVLAEDVLTNNWYLVLEPSDEFKAHELRPRDKSSKALTFCSQQLARDYYQAHDLHTEKSVRTLVSASAVEHKGIKLYPLTPLHSTKTPVVPAPVELAAVASPTPVAQESAQPTDAGALPTEASAPASVAADAETRLEQLTDKWYEADITSIEESELTELIDGLGAKPKKERDIVENTVLNRAKSERVRRSKKGSNRG